MSGFSSLFTLVHPAVGVPVGVSPPCARLVHARNYAQKPPDPGFRAPGAALCKRLQILSVHHIRAGCRINGRSICTHQMNVHLALHMHEMSGKIRAARQQRGLAG